MCVQVCVQVYVCTGVCAGECAGVCVCAPHHALTRLNPSTRRRTGTHLSPAASTTGQKERCRKSSPLTSHNLDKPYRSPKQGAGKISSFVDHKYLLAFDVLIIEI